MIDAYNPAPGGENHTRPCRPRPAVCMSATTIVPCSAPDSARRAATSFVDPVDSSQWMHRPMPRARGATRDISRAMSVGTACQSNGWSGGLDVKADVDRGSRMRKRSGGHEISARRGQLWNARERDTP